MFSAVRPLLRPGGTSLPGRKSPPVTPSGYRLAVKSLIQGAIRVKPSTDAKSIDKTECRSR